MWHLSAGHFLKWKYGHGCCCLCRSGSIHVMGTDPVFVILMSFGSLRHLIASILRTAFMRFSNNVRASTIYCLIAVCGVFLVYRGDRG